MANKFNKGDFVTNQDTNSHDFLCHGLVRVSYTSGMLDVIMIDGSESSWHCSLCDPHPNPTKVAAIFAAAGIPSSAQQPWTVAQGQNNPVTPAVGDEVKVTALYSGLRDLIGTVIAVQQRHGTVCYDVEFQHLAGYYTFEESEIEITRRLVTAPTMPSHYGAVISEDPAAPTAEPEPFRHVDLGTNLSGDELMESIRSICGR